MFYISHEQPRTNYRLLVVVYRKLRRFCRVAISSLVATYTLTLRQGFVIHGYLGGRTLFTKAVGLALSVASGLSLGKEGPFVHIASCIGNIISRITSKYENNEGE